MTAAISSQKNRCGKLMAFNFVMAATEGVNPLWKAVAGVIFLDWIEIIATPNQRVADRLCHPESRMARFRAI